ncbi:MAG: hypothetical protein FWD69_01490 [Polyangiaceae bacterium]|nr:hypothetical protein [Polyangiaceae bacterium]
MATTRARAAVPMLLFGLAFSCGEAAPPPKMPAVVTVAGDPGWMGRASEACALVASCTQSTSRLPSLHDPAACMAYWIGRGGPDAHDPLRSCLGGAKTCSDVATCLRGGGDARAAVLCASQKGVVTACDGERFISCGDDAEGASVVDCAALGGSCREQRSEGGLTIRGCFAPRKCPPDAPETRCDGGDAVVHCQGGTIERTTCTTGTHCEERTTDSGEILALCTLHGMRRCNMLGARRCDGDRLVECADGGTTVTDCAASGMKCTGLGLRANCTVPSNAECDGDMPARCEDGGRALVFCAAGRITKVACETIGLGACVPAGRTEGAACAVPQKDEERVYH